MAKRKTRAKSRAKTPPRDSKGRFRKTGKGSK